MHMQTEALKVVSPSPVLVRQREAAARQLQQCLRLISQEDLLKMLEAPGNSGLSVQRRDVQKGGFSTLCAASNLKETGTHLMPSRPVPPYIGHSVFIDYQTTKYRTIRSQQFPGCLPFPRYQSLCPPEPHFQILGLRQDTGNEARCAAGIPCHLPLVSAHITDKHVNSTNYDR
jgi:hypothetical protein